MSEQILIIGGGGHAKVVIEALRLVLPNAVLSILDSAPAMQGARVLDVAVIGTDALLTEAVRQGFTGFAMGIGSTGDTGRRQAAYERARGCGLHPVTVIHPAATVSPSARIGEGAQILAGAIVAACAEIGENALLNHRALVDHDCRIGAHCHISVGATLGGAVTVGAGAHIGAGAVVRQGSTVGAGAVVAAGAIVVKPVAAGTVVMGVAARERTS